MTYGYFKRQAGENSYEKIWRWRRRGNLKRETEFLLVAAQNDAIGINHVKGEINNTEKNSKNTLCGDRDETVNPKSCVTRGC